MKNFIQKVIGLPRAIKAYVQPTIDSEAWIIIWFAGFFFTVAGIYDPPNFFTDMGQLCITVGFILCISKQRIHGKLGNTMGKIFSKDQPAWAKVKLPTIRGGIALLIFVSLTALYLNHMWHIANRINWANYILVLVLGLQIIRMMISLLWDIVRAPFWYAAWRKQARQA